VQEAPAPGRAALESDRLTRSRAADGVTLFLCGDVMLGRGIDQILPHPGNPRLHESYMRSAIGYVELAERATGPIGRRVDYAYVWGDTLAECAQTGAQVRIVNLETAVTTSDDAWPGKGIHYRMHPANVPCLVAGSIDCCALANNHVLDWGYRGLDETLTALHAQHIRTAGAGRTADGAAAPAVIEVDAGRVLVFAFGTDSAGVSRSWAATAVRGGVNHLEDLSSRSAERVARHVERHKRDRDVVIASIHWGGNWGYAVDDAQRSFAHALVDIAHVDLVHGHSSHHPRGLEVYRGHLVLYGCGDYLNDYEGIGGHEAYRGDLALAYFPAVDVTSGRLLRATLVPMQIRHMRTTRAPTEDVRWLEKMLNREGARFGTRVTPQADDRLSLAWS
jgi:poly-gamma-glutamate synthesis protein (capsule biosynthesis protein)